MQWFFQKTSFQIKTKLQVLNQYNMMFETYPRHFRTSNVSEITVYHSPIMNVEISLENEPDSYCTI